MDPYHLTFQTWNQIADAYQERFLDVDLYNDTYDAFCTQLDQPRPRIFEIGCGPGNITRYLLSKRPDFEIAGIDVAPRMVELARVNNPTAQFIVMDCREMSSLTSRFDGIMCGFCLPYLAKADAAKLIQDCAGLLHPNGIFYLSVIEGDYARAGYETGSSGQGGMYVYYYREAELRQALEGNGFELLHIYRKSFTQNDGNTSTHLIFLARKGRS